MVTKIDLVGYDEFKRYADTLDSKTSKAIFYFSGTKLADGTSWCPDCVEGKLNNYQSILQFTLQLVVRRVTTKLPIAFPFPEIKIIYITIFIFYYQLILLSPSPFPYPFSKTSVAQSAMKQSSSSQYLCLYNKRHTECRAGNIKEMVF